MINYVKASTKKDLKEILKLQKRNLPNDLSDLEKAKEGFVTVHHNLSILKEMNDACPHTIAKHNDEVVGYALSMTKDFGDKIEVLKPMFLEISKIITDEKYLVMGQICIDKNYRKQGIFRGLYNFMKTEVCSNNFDIIITEIDIDNLRSINAHKAIGFEKLVDYKYGDKNWSVVSFKV